MFDCFHAKGVKLPIVTNKLISGRSRGGEIICRDSGKMAYVDDFTFFKVNKYTL